MGTISTNKQFSFAYSRIFVFFEIKPVMPNQVIMSAIVKCSHGVAPSSLVVLPKNKVLSGNMPSANIMDNIPLLNILPFGMCNSMGNPTVAAATSAALGVLTPMPCVPMTSSSPWSPGSKKAMIGGQPALTNSCKLNCMWGGSISVVTPGCLNVMV